MLLASWPIEARDGGGLGHRLKAGDYKFIGNFPHFVADGGDDRVGRWLDEKVDLARVYAEIWKDHAHRQHQLLRVCPV